MYVTMFLFNIVFLFLLSLASSFQIRGLVAGLFFSVYIYISLDLMTAAFAFSFIIRVVKKPK